MGDRYGPGGSDVFAMYEPGGRREPYGPEA